MPASQGEPTFGCSACRQLHRRGGVRVDRLHPLLLVGRRGHGCAALRWRRVRTRSLHDRLLPGLPRRLLPDLAVHLLGRHRHLAHHAHDRRRRPAARRLRAGTHAALLSRHRARAAPWRRLFWSVCWFFGAFGIGAILLFGFGNLPNTNFQKHAVPHPSLGFRGGFQGFVLGMPFTSWFFIGVEALNLASNDVRHPKATIPVVQMACLATMMATGLIAGLVSVSLPIPGGIVAMTNSLQPLTFGFTLVLRVSVASVTWITILPVYGVAFGFMWAYARLIRSMASSRLLPPVLAKANRFGTARLAHIVGSSIGYALCLAMYFEPMVIYVFPITMAFSFLSYAGQCIGYILLKLQHPVMRQSLFKSPFGIHGAVFSLLIWVFCMAGVLWDGKALVGIVPMAVVLTVYYVLVAKERQTFSDEENKILLTAHVSRFNAMRRKGKPRAKAAKVAALRAAKLPKAAMASAPSKRSSVERDVSKVGAQSSAYNAPSAGAEPMQGPRPCEVTPWRPHVETSSG